VIETRNTWLAAASAAAVYEVGRVRVTSCPFAASTVPVGSVGLQVAPLSVEYSAVDDTCTSPACRVSVSTPWYTDVP
jgi:hypothetical protein